MKIALASDDAGLDYKLSIIEHLKSKGYETIDFGLYEHQRGADYPDYSLPAAEAVAGGKADMGVFVCGTGLGMEISANKVRGIRCACCTTPFMAQMTREHNDANILALGQRVIDLDTAIQLTDIFLTTPFSGEERHARRIAKIKAIEDKYCK